MDAYTRKTQALIKKIASYLVYTKTTYTLKDSVTELVREYFGNTGNAELYNENEYRDLRVALLNSGHIDKLFPEIASTRQTENEQARKMLLQFIAFEATALPRFLNKQDYKFEDLKAFINITYYPSVNPTDNDNILSAYFNVTMFFFKDKQFEYVIKPAVQYVLTPDKKVNESSVLKFLK
ncbi:MAG: hypothetical protein IJ681_09755 [Bacteroidales bacterium]|nr:hypothetical protein [Bacteroidales bacterium]